MITSSSPCRSERGLHIILHIEPLTLIDGREEGLKSFPLAFLAHLLTLGNNNNNYNRKSCNADKSDVRLAACTHCGATNWNILGDSESGYVLSEGDGKFCLVREKNSKKAKVVSCEKGGYTALQLQCT